MLKMANDGCSYVLILNIPSHFHAADLRNYFSDFVESQKFSCFHFRHRPQSELIESWRKSYPFLVTSNPLCCLVSCNTSDKSKFVNKYMLQHWYTLKDEILPQRCIIASVKVDTNPEAASVLPVQLFDLHPGKQQLEFQLPLAKLECFFELKPPVLMPRGNVGTPTKHFLALIKTCQLPSKLIGKLGLNFPKSRTRKYGNVPFDYGNYPGADKASCTNRIREPKVIKIPPREQHPTCSRGTDEEAEEEEEWDRHEALHEDVTEQERTKERLYEEEEEVVWEKGGPGIVWYTDAQLWKEAEGDFDEQTSDDWDVDYSVYFEENGGDMDARDAVEMRRSTMKRQGDLEESVFKKPRTTTSSRPPAPPRLRNSTMKAGFVGPFEQYTRGIGRRLMERHGWRDGTGLGRSQKGIAEPIESEGQKPKERKGLGYYGEQLPRFGHAPVKKSKPVLIATVYDRPSETDPPETLLQRNETTSMKYRVRN